MTETLSEKHQHMKLWVFEDNKLAIVFLGTVQILDSPHLTAFKSAAAGGRLLILIKNIQTG